MAHPDQAGGPRKQRFLIDVSASPGVQGPDLGRSCLARLLAAACLLMPTLSFAARARAAPSSLATYRRGLKKVSSAADARQAAAAVLILALGDPGQRRWPIKENLIRVRKDRWGWVCIYPHDAHHASEVKFDRDGVLSAVA